MTKRARTHTSSQTLRERIQIKATYAGLKIIEGNDITLALNRTRNHDTKSQLQWVCCSLQQEVYKLRGDIIRRQGLEDDKADIIRVRFKAHRQKSWFQLFFEWIKSIPIGKRDEYVPESFTRPIETEIPTKVEVESINESTENNGSRSGDDGVNDDSFIDPLLAN